LPQIVSFVIALVSVVLATFFVSTNASNFNLVGEKSDGALDYPQVILGVIKGWVQVCEYEA